MRESGNTCVPELDVISGNEKVEPASQIQWRLVLVLYCLVGIAGAEEGAKAAFLIA